MSVGGRGIEGRERERKREKEREREREITHKPHLISLAVVDRVCDE